MPTDYALSVHAQAWLRHPVLGDPSFDAFVRHPGNPVHRGAPPREWPVNGFVFADPVSGHWYAYVGHYPAGYAQGPGQRMVCTVFESTDGWRTWRHRGPVFRDEPFVLHGTRAPADRAPDATVVWDAGRYHMAYDWVTADARDLRGGQSGVGYAWSHTPRGPFHREPAPLLLNDAFRDAPLLGKYDRLYASTLVRRRDDWVLLTITDSGPHYSWGLVGASAAAPAGPYSAPVVLFHTEGDAYHPPLMEYFPAFVHDGWVYAPSTSVALNRTFQMLHRAPLEEALRPEVWELFQHGSLWHGEPVEHEAHGIWGQTFSGCVDSEGVFHVLFPSRDESGLGTINLASRPWSPPLRPRGFHLAGHRGPSLACLRRAYGAFALDVELSLRGQAALLWAMQGPLGPDAPRADAALHALIRTQYQALELTPDGWRVVSVDRRGGGHALGEGTWPSRARRPTAQAAAAAGVLRVPGASRALSCSVHRDEDGTVRVWLDGALVWEGVPPETHSAGTDPAAGTPAGESHTPQTESPGRPEADEPRMPRVASRSGGEGPSGPQAAAPSASLRWGGLGLLVEAASYAEVKRFAVAGAPRPAWVPFLYTEGLLGAGQSLEDWDEVEAPWFRFGRGALSRSADPAACRPAVRAKWGFHGCGFRLWMPRTPEAGRVEVLLDGRIVAQVETQAGAPEPSAPLLALEGLADGLHAVVVRPRRGRLAVDCLDVAWPG
ncbi:MAG: hypothetical protein AB1505_31285 [Candidatus Latescibacterota bacterium]